MARPSQPIFDHEEEEQLIIPMTQLGVRLIARNWEAKVVTSEYSYVRTLLQAERIVSELSNKCSAPSYEAADDGSIFYRIIPSRLMQSVGVAWKGLSEVLSEGGSNLEKPAPKTRIAPKLKAFHSAYKKLMLFYSEQAVGISSSALEKSFLNEFGHLNEEAFADLKKRLKSSGLRKESKQAQTRMYRNRQSLLGYLDGLFTLYPKLYVVRLDLGYNISDSSVARTLTYVRAKEEFDIFMAHRHRNPMWKDDLVGFIWKLEDGAERRYHYHLLLFYDGERAERHHEDQQRLQDRWIDDITGGDGACFISWEKPEETPLGVSPDGLIMHDDSAKRKALLVYLNYLTKIDRLIGVEAPNSVRIFGKGQLPK